MHPKGAGPVKQVAVHGRAAKRESLASGACALTVRVSDTSRVDTIVNMADPSKSCAAAKQVAETVEPHLPGKG